MKTRLMPIATLGKYFVLPAALLAGLALNANAQIYSVESFNGYTVGSQVPSTSPSPTVAGYTGNWTTIDWGTQWPTVYAGSLSYAGAGYAASSGNNIGVPNAAFDESHSGRMYRLLDSSLAANSATSGTLYLSWLFQSGNQGPTTYQMLNLYNGDTADAHRTFTAGITQNGGNSGNQYDFGVNEGYHSAGVNVDTSVHLFVAKFSLSASPASDSVTVWLDPALGAGDPLGGIAISGQDIAFDRLAISDYDENSANWSDIRWGATFDSVTSTPVPEPSALALLGLGGLAALLRRKQA
jgi:PEP-CTERM motif